MKSSLALLWHLKLTLKPRFLWKLCAAKTYTLPAITGGFKMSLNIPHGGEFDKLHLADVRGHNHSVT